MSVLFVLVLACSNSSMLQCQRDCKTEKNASNQNCLTTKGKCTVLTPGYAPAVRKGFLRNYLLAYLISWWYYYVAIVLCNQLVNFTSTLDLPFIVKSTLAIVVITCEPCH